MSVSLSCVSGILASEKQSAFLRDLTVTSLSNHLVSKAACTSHAKI